MDLTRIKLIYGMRSQEGVAMLVVKPNCILEKPCGNCDKD